ncbi:MAG: four-carbon acid sugar kinase family protein [Bacteroidota bacterium]
MTARILASIASGSWQEELAGQIRDVLRRKPRTIVVLDDDPTGTQTMHEVPVITDFDQAVIDAEMQQSPLFYILTNSRSLQADEANTLAQTLGERIRLAADKQGKEVLVISRGDSTLRGHYPGEVDALAAGLGISDARQVLIPAFFEGGRYTFEDIHYVREGEQFIPAAETPFAQDNTFGYESSDLGEWIREKRNRSVSPEEIHPISLDELRREGGFVFSRAHYLISNATGYRDLQAMALACLQEDEPLVYRTAASFVNAISGTKPRPLLKAEELQTGETTYGGLVVVGSYVPKSTRQLQYVQEQSEAHFMEVPVARIQAGDFDEAAITALAGEATEKIKSGINVVLYTSRAVATGTTKAESLALVNRVSEVVQSIVRQIGVRPRFLLAKGGITSSDIATKALGVKRARVLGQIAKGIPVWRLGPETRFPDMPYIIFPGNVGDDQTLHAVINSLSP